MPVYPCHICGLPKTKYEYTRMRNRYLNRLTPEEILQHLVPYLSTSTLNSLTSTIDLDPRAGINLITLYARNPAIINVCRKCLDMLLFPNYSEEELGIRFNLGGPIIYHEGSETLYAFPNLTGRKFTNNSGVILSPACDLCGHPTTIQEAEDEQATIDMFDLTDYIGKHVCHSCTFNLVQQAKGL